MAGSEDKSGQLDAGHVTGAPRSGAGLGALDQYEYGTISPLTRQGRYKAFATAFSARPVVIITPFRAGATGTIFPVFAGTPNVGSFNARLVMPGAAAGVGSVNCHYLAFGQR